MGQTSFFGSGPDESAAPAPEAAQGTDSIRQASFFSGGIPESSRGIGSYLALIQKAVEDTEAYRDETKAYRDETKALYDSFLPLFSEFVTELYMGAFVSPPTVGYFGGPLVEGVICYDLNDNVALMWNGVAWEPWATRVGPAGEVGPAGLPGV